MQFNYDGVDNLTGRVSFTDFVFLDKILLTIECSDYQDIFDNLKILFSKKIRKPINFDFYIQSDGIEIVQEDTRKIVVFIPINPDIVKEYLDKDD